LQAFVSASDQPTVESKNCFFPKNDFTPQKRPPASTLGRDWIVKSILLEQVHEHCTPTITTIGD
jgi:hypothetical protein